MNGLIYLIVNRLNGKSYVGQTSVGLKRRYRPKWWKWCHNPYLKHSIEKYGIDSFEWEILEMGLETVERLNEREVHWAKTLDTYAPKGYNIRPCGDNRGPLAKESCEKISVALSKQHTLKRITGEIVVIDHMRSFCKEHGLNCRALHNLLCGLSDYSQGFVRVDTDPNTTVMGRVYTFMSPSGEIVRGCLSHLCKQYDLKHHTLAHLIHGHVKRSKGWSLVTRDAPCPT